MSEQASAVASERRELVPQPHGGALLPGGGGGRENGLKGGRPPSLVRARCRNAFSKHVPTLAKIADGSLVLPEGESISTADQLKAIDLLGKYGLGVVKEVSSEAVRERMVQTLGVIRARCSAELAAEIVAELRPIWA